MNQSHNTAKSVNTIRLITLMILFLFLYLIDTYDDSEAMSRHGRGVCDDSSLVHKYIVEKFYNTRKHWRTSNLGAIMFKNIDRALYLHSHRENRKFVILVWRYWKLMQESYAGRNSTNKQFEDYLDGCSVRNCMFTGNDSYLHAADALVVYSGNIPHFKFRNSKQRWVFMSDESPRNTFSSIQSICERPSLSSLANIFNWTMTYRSDSDVPVPYGRTVPLLAPVISNKYYENDLIPDLIPYWTSKRHDVLATVLISNCGDYRMRFIKQLLKHIHVDVYGKCAFKKEIRQVCPDNLYADCEIISNYLFYLAFENSNCRQYITEKVFYYAYAKGAIPIIKGPPLEDCEKLLPPNSFIHVDTYTSLDELAKHMKRIISNENLLLSYHKWRNHFQVVYEHKYFGGISRHYCRLCEALNYNDGEVSIYDEDNMSIFFDPNITCKKLKCIGTHRQ